MALVRNRIEKRYVILCEGIDTFNFMLQYLKSNALSYDQRFSNDIQLFDFGGIDNLYTFILSLKGMENFDAITRLLIIRDAETSVERANNMIHTALTKSDLPVPKCCHSWTTEGVEIQTAFTLMPTCSPEPSTGALEDLCWDILKDEHACQMKKDIQEFIWQMKKKYNSIQTHEHKSRLHSYFSVNEKLISLKIGEAAKAGAFDWNSPKLQSLKELLEQGFE